MTIKDGMNYGNTVTALMERLDTIRRSGIHSVDEAEALKEALVLCDRLKCFQPYKPISGEYMEGFIEGFKEGVKMMVELERKHNE